MFGRLIKVMVYRDDECRLVKSSVTIQCLKRSRDMISKDTTTYSKIDNHIVSLSSPRYNDSHDELYN